ncbi:MAG: hypothetical protein QF414_09170, partial [Arenicellales bacterium]|nr:hypothetical protein [Arenicellales bacterium]
DQDRLPGSRNSHIEITMNTARPAPTRPTDIWPWSISKYKNAAPTTNVMMETMILIWTGIGRGAATELY